MSKKSRLKAQKDKQIQMKRLADLEELEEKEAAKYKESRSAKKMRRSAKRGYTNLLFVLMKLLMLAAFLYSGFVYGGIMIVGAFGDMADFIAKKTAAFILSGDVLMIVGLVLVFLNKYKLQAFFNIIGSALFGYAANIIVKDIQQRLEHTYVEPELASMDRQYMGYLYPIFIITVLSVVFLIIGTVRFIKRKNKEREQKDNAPVSSIVD